MGRRVLIVVVLLILALFAYMRYHTYDAKRAGGSGDVFSVDSPSGTSKADTVVLGSPENSQPANAAPATERAPVLPDATTRPVAATDAPVGSGSDTISPNPPNGMTFSGTGRYQVYRQGNLTWRIDTNTGRSCILFATDEEWKKPKVYRAGCGRR
jgi:hypothetical protein